MGAGLAGSGPSLEERMDSRSGRSLSFTVRQLTDSGSYRATPSAHLSQCANTVASVGLYEFLLLGRFVHQV